MAWSCASCYGTSHHVDDAGYIICLGCGTQDFATQNFVEEGEDFGLEDLELGGAQPRNKKWPFLLSFEDWIKTLVKPRRIKIDPEKLEEKFAKTRADAIDAALKARHDATETTPLIQPSLLMGPMLSDYVIMLQRVLFRTYALWSKARGFDSLEHSERIETIWGAYLNYHFNQKKAVLSVSDYERKIGMYLLSPDLYRSLPARDGRYFMELRQSNTDKRVKSALGRLPTLSPTYYTQYVLDRLRTRTLSTQGISLTEARQKAESEGEESRISRVSGEEEVSPFEFQEIFGTKYDHSEKKKPLTGLELHQSTPQIMLDTKDCPKHDLDPEFLAEIPFEEMTPLQRRLFGPKRVDMFAGSFGYGYLFPQSMNKSKNKQMFSNYSDLRFQTKMTFFRNRRDFAVFRRWVLDEHKARRRDLQRKKNIKLLHFRGLRRATSHIGEWDDQDALENRPNRIFQRDRREDQLPRFYSRAPCNKRGMNKSHIYQPWKHTLPLRGYRDITYATRSKNPLKAGRRLVQSSYASIKEVEQGRGSVLNIRTMRIVFTTLMISSNGPTHNKRLDTLIKGDPRAVAPLGLSSASSLEVFIMKQYSRSFPEAQVYPEVTGQQKSSPTDIYSVFMMQRLYENALLLEVVSHDPVMEDRFRGMVRAVDGIEVDTKSLPPALHHSLGASDAMLEFIQSIISIIESKSLNSMSLVPQSDEWIAEDEHLYEEFQSSKYFVALNKKRRFDAAGVDLGGQKIVTARATTDSISDTFNIIKILWIQGFIMRELNVTPPNSMETELPIMSGEGSYRSHEESDIKSENVDPIIESDHEPIARTMETLLPVKWADYLDYINRVKTNPLSLSTVWAVIFIVSRSIDSTSGLSVAAFLDLMGKSDVGAATSPFDVLPEWSLMMEPERYPGQFSFVPTSLHYHNSNILRSSVIRVIESDPENNQIASGRLDRCLVLNFMRMGITADSDPRMLRFVNEVFDVANGLADDTLNYHFGDLTDQAKSGLAKNKTPVMIGVIAASMMYNWILPSYQTSHMAFTKLVQMTPAELLIILWHAGRSNRFSNVQCKKTGDKNGIVFQTLTPYVPTKAHDDPAVFPSLVSNRPDGRKTVTETLIDGYIDSARQSNRSALSMDMIVGISIIVATCRQCPNGFQGHNADLFATIIRKLRSQEKDVIMSHVEVEELRIKLLKFRGVSKTATNQAATLQGTYRSPFTFVSEEPKKRTKLMKYHETMAIATHESLEQGLSMIRQATTQRRGHAREVRTYPDESPGASGEPIFPEQGDRGHWCITDDQLAPLIENLCSFMKISPDIAKSLVHVYLLQEGEQNELFHLLSKHLMNKIVNKDDRILEHSLAVPPP